MDNFMSFNVVEESKKAHEGRQWNKYNVEHITKEEIDKIITMCNETRPEGLEYRSEGELCIRHEYNGLEECMSELESELEQQQTNECSNVMLSSIHINELHLK